MLPATALTLWMSAAALSQPQPPPEWREFIEAARAAESIPNWLERCRAFPAIPGNAWPEEHWDMQCEYYLDWTDIPRLAEIERMVNDGETAELDAWYSRILDRHFDGSQRDALFKAFEIFSAQSAPLTDEWLRAAPESAYAMTARGHALIQVAWTERGDRRAARTPKSQMDAMRGTVEEAWPLLMHALELEPRLVPACARLVEVGRITSEPMFEFTGISACLAIDPTSFRIYYQWLMSAVPKWGGSIAQMDIVKDSATRWADENPMLLVLLQSSLGDLAADTFYTGEFPAAKLELLEREIVQLPSAMRFAGLHDAADDLGDRWRAVAYASSAMALRPADWMSLQMRGYYYFHLGDFQSALADFREYYRRGGRRPWALVYYGQAAARAATPLNAEVVAALELAAEDPEYAGSAVYLLFDHFFEQDGDAERLDRYTRLLIEHDGKSAAAWYRRTKYLHRQQDEAFRSAGRMTLRMHEEAGGDMTVGWAAWVRRIVEGDAP